MKDIDFLLEAGEDGLEVYANGTLLKGDLKKEGLRYCSNRGKMTALRNDCDGIVHKILETLMGDQ